MKALSKNELSYLLELARNAHDASEDPNAGATRKRCVAKLEAMLAKALR